MTDEKQDRINLFNELNRDIGTLVELAEAARETETLREIAGRLDEAMDKLQAILWPESVEKKP